MDYRNFLKIWFRNERFVWQIPPQPETPKPAPTAPAGASEAAPSKPVALPATPKIQAADATKRAQEAAKTGADATKKLEQTDGPPPANPAASGDKKSDTPPAAAEAAAALAVAAEAAEEDSTGGGAMDKIIKVLEKMIDQITAYLDKLFGGKGKKPEAKETSLLGGATKLVIAKKYEAEKANEGIGITTTKDQQIFPPKGGIIEEITADSMTIKTSVGEKITYKGITPNPSLKKDNSLTAGGVVMGQAKGETVTIIAEKDGKFLDPTPLVSKYVQPEPAAPAATPTPVSEAKPADKKEEPKKGGKAAAAEAKEAAPASPLKLSAYRPGIGVDIEGPAKTDIKLFQAATVISANYQRRILVLQLPTYKMTISNFNIDPELKTGTAIKSGGSVGKTNENQTALVVCRNNSPLADIDPTPFLTGQPQPKNPELEITNYLPETGHTEVTIKIKTGTELKFSREATVKAVDRNAKDLTLGTQSGDLIYLSNINSQLNLGDKIQPFQVIGDAIDKQGITVRSTRRVVKTQENPYVDPTFFFKAPEKKKEEKNS